MIQKIAKLISTIGHPLLTVPMVVIFLMFRYETPQNAFFVSGLIILGLIVPIIIKLLKNLKSGKITNFDVSNQQQRNGFYRFIIPLVLAINVILYITDQNPKIQLSFFLATLLLISLRVINLWIKASIHVSVNVYLAYLLFLVDPKLSLVYGFVIGLIAWSRLEMGRHTMREILIGSILGNVFGLIYVLLSNSIQ